MTREIIPFYRWHSINVLDVKKIIEITRTTSNKRRYK